MIQRLTCILALCIAISGCAAPTIEGFCLLDKPIQPSNTDIDRLSDAAIDRIYDHDCWYYWVCKKEKYQEVCDQ